MICCSSQLKPPGALYSSSKCGQTGNKRAGQADTTGRDEQWTSMYHLSSSLRSVVPAASVSWTELRQPAQSVCFADCNRAFCGEAATNKDCSTRASTMNGPRGRSRKQQAPNRAAMDHGEMMMGNSIKPTHNSTWRHIESPTLIETHQKAAFTCSDSGPAGRAQQGCWGGNCVVC